MVIRTFYKNNGEGDNMCREINLGRDCNGDGDENNDDITFPGHIPGDGRLRKFTILSVVLLTCREKQRVL